MWELKEFIHIKVLGWHRDRGVSSVNASFHGSEWGVGKDMLLMEPPALATSTWDLKYLVARMDEVN